MEPIIQTYQLQKTFGGEQALKPLDFSLQKGEICALIGKNGAGKSTFFKILSGQIVATAGEVHLFGKSGDAVASQKSRLGFMVESPQFFPDFTAAQNMEYFRIQRGVVEKARVTEVLKLVGLSHHRKKKFHEYSMGMKQRLGIALCLLSGPDCLVLDEPINGLDAEGIKEVRQLLLELNQRKQMTILVSSHLLAELQLIASRFVFIKDGTVVEDVSKAELEDKSKKQLILHVDLPAKAVQLLERQYEGVDYLLLPNKGLKLFNYLDFASEINRLLVENGIEVREIQYESLNLEDYFLGLVEDDVYA